MAQHEYPLRVLIIDHYDSYTNNLLSLLQGSLEAETSHSPAWRPVIIRYDQYKWDEFRTSVLPLFDAIILSPGPGRPDREADFGFNSQLIREAEIPIFGICLGHQGIGTSFGAEIIHAPHIKHGQVSHIQHDGSSLFDGLPQGFAGVRYNSLLVDPYSLPSELVATAWTQDLHHADHKVLMGVRHVARPIVGVQWHPESICSSHGQAIMDNFRAIVQAFWSSQKHLATRFAARSRTDDLFAHFLDNVETGGGMLGHRETKPCRTESSNSCYDYHIKAVELGPGPHPESVFVNLVKGASKDGEIWLDSAKSRDQFSRYSYLASGAFSVKYSTTSKLVSLSKDGDTIKSQPIDHSFWDWFDVFQTKIQNCVRCIEAEQMLDGNTNKRATLQLGFLGYFGYEMKRQSLTGYHKAEHQPMTEANFPDAQFLFAQTVLQYEHRSGSWRMFCLVRKSASDPIAEMIGSQTPIGLNELEVDQYMAKVKATWDAGLTSLTPKISLSGFSSATSSDSYIDAIDLARHAIREGESYEMTVTTKFRAKLKRQDPFALYCALRAKNPAPYAAYLHFPGSDMSILSSSPERFISITRDGIAEMKPIKGTVARSKDQDEDAARRHRLATDVKELAENLMIVDLIRSDLHNVSPSGSVTVPKLMQVESYETVHQLVTTIQSCLDPSIGPVKAIKAIFPPGSMTGAPKLRSVQIIEELEQQQERGVYSGCLGYICVSGAADQSVVIRTIVRKGDEFELGAGGAITWLSHPEKEWEEVLVKANAVADVTVT